MKMTLYGLLQEAIYQSAEADKPVEVHVYDAAGEVSTYFLESPDISRADGGLVLRLSKKGMKL